MSSIYDLLDPRDKQIYGMLSEQISKHRGEQLALLRKAAGKNGILAQNLSDLKSKSGEPFREEKESGRRWGDDGYQMAIAGTGFKAETAYLCREMRLFKSPDDKGEGCGWVKGEPVKKRYHDIGPLSGSAGTRFFCRICGQQIGETVTRRS